MTNPLNHNCIKILLFRNDFEIRDSQQGSTNCTDGHGLGLHRCWWRMLETKCVGDKFEMLVTDSGCRWPIKYIEKITNITIKVSNILILPPTSAISHYHKVANISMSPTSLSPFMIIEKKMFFFLFTLWFV